LPVYINAPRKNRVSRKGVELLTNITRIDITTTRVDLNGENILMVDKTDKQ